MIMRFYACFTGHTVNSFIVIIILIDYYADKLIEQ